MLPIDQLIQLPEYPNLKSQWSALKDANEIWHAYYFMTEPKNFMAWVIKEGPGLPNEKAWYAALKSILNRSVGAPFIQTKIVENRDVGEPFLVSLYPEWGEWYQSWRIMYDLENWIKGALYYQESVISDADTRQKYIADVKRLLKAYGPDNWQERLGDELRAKFISVFMRDEIQAAQAASAELSDIKNKKIFGFAIVAAVGLFAASQLFGKKR